LAQGLISVKLKEHRSTRASTVEAIEPGEAYQFGDAFKVTWFRVCHSIPDAMGLIIETPLGTVIHTGDFKIDHTPVDGHTIDLPALTLQGAAGVLLLCSDSTYAELPGYTPSEQIMGDALDNAVAGASGRVMVATFASLISRIQQVINAADKHHRKVSIIGRSMVDNVKMATEMGYLNVPQDLILPLSQTRNLPPEQVVIITTGSQGEPTSALVRIANQDHREVNIQEGDTVVISATPIPGNELYVSRTIDNLLRQGAKVLYHPVATVHVHGHASQEELKMMLSMTKPRYFIPVHGEHRHLVAHAKIAWDLGLGRDGIFVLRDGDVLELTENGGKVVDQVSAGPIYIDGLSTHDMTSPVLRDRRSLSRDGVVAVVVSTDKATHRLSGSPKIVSSGFMDPAETEDTFQSLCDDLEQSFIEDLDVLLDQDRLKTKVREIASRFLYNKTHRRPMIIPVVLETEKA